MGLFKGSFVFSLGAFSGVYVAQNYTIPNLKTFITTGLLVAKKLETEYRKPPKVRDPTALWRRKVENLRYD